MISSGLVQSVTVLVLLGLTSIKWACKKLHILHQMYTFCKCLVGRRTFELFLLTFWCGWYWRKQNMAFEMSFYFEFWLKSKKWTTTPPYYNRSMLKQNFMKEIAFLFKSKYWQSDSDTTAPLKQNKGMLKQSKNVWLLHLTILFHENLIDPGKLFWYVCKDVGYIWVVTVPTLVERHNTNCHPIAHQRTTRITLLGRSIIICLLIV